jgi:protoporphyrinogen oxidase
VTTVGIVGAGAMGLAAAYHALEAGHRVTVYEADSVAGGMAAHTDLDGLSIERFYHFVCRADASTFALMAALGIGDAMRWRDTSMGYFVDGRLYPWGDPLALLTFPKLSPVAKFRYGLQMFLSTRRADADALEMVTARHWIERGAGREAYEVLWRRLFELKFFEYADRVSAAWIWTRIKRIGTSRRSLMQEQLGYIEGGSQTLVRALVTAIERRGGAIRLATPVREIVTEGGRVTGIRTDAGTDPVDAAISTMPTPYVPALVPGLPEDWKARYAAIVNIGVVCVLLRLRKSVSPHFWVNINDPAVEIPGLIEFSRLRPVEDTVVYVPFYMPQTHPKFDRDDAAFVAESMAAIRRVNPAIGEDDLLASQVGRLRHAQPVCEAGFAAKIPPIQTPIVGLQIADTAFYYPEDRGISESVRYGALMAAGIGG